MTSAADSPPPPEGDAEGAPSIDARPWEPGPPSDRDLADLDRNDDGNGERLRRRYGQDLLAVDELQRDLRDGWLVWSGKHWEPRGAYATARKWADLTARAIKAEAQALKDDRDPERFDFEQHGDTKAALKAYDERIAAHRKWAVQSGNLARGSAMLAKAAPYLLIQQEELDRDPLLLNVATETLTLPRGGHLGAESLAEIHGRPHDRADRLSRLAPVSYDPDATCPTFRAFLESVLPEPETRAFVQRFFGYALTGLTGGQVLLLFYGHGANGKSTFLNLMRWAFGSYAVTLPFRSLLADERSKGGDATPDLVRLPGARLATASEPEVGAVLSESMIKSQTGGEPMIVRAMFRDFFEFTPTHKLVLSFNNKPKIRGQDEGTWRRLAMVPWEVTIPEHQRDAQLAEKIWETEGPGLLNWLLDGYREWAEKGLAIPEAVRQATQEYRTESDPIDEFLKACVTHTEKPQTPGVSARDLFDAYSRFAKLNGQDPIKQQWFGRLLTEKGFHKRRGLGGRYEYSDVILDLQLIEDLEAADKAAGYGGDPGPDEGDMR